MSVRPDPPTTERLRHDIDSGRTGDKVDHSDPAAAPLGADDEAAGAPPTRRQRAMEAAARPKDEARREGFGPVALYVGLVVAIGCIVAALVLGLG